MKETLYLGVPFNAGQSRRGTADAPDFFRQVNASAFYPGGWHDLGDVAAPDYRGRTAALEHAQKLSNTIRSLNLKNRFLALVGGDHGQGLGTVHGLLQHYPELIVVWIDAHADANVPSASPTGNMHGMPLAWLLGAQEERPWWMTHTLSPKKLIYVGVRDIDPYERMLIDELDIVWIKPGLGPEQLRLAIQRELDLADPQGNCPVHISFDVDALDAALVPSTGTPVHGGLSVAEVETAFMTIKEERQVVSAEIVEINPELGSQEEARALTSWAHDMFSILTPTRQKAEKLSWQARALSLWD